jgi:hypothetical protein
MNNEVGQITDATGKYDNQRAIEVQSHVAWDNQSSRGETEHLRKNKTDYESYAD